MAQISGIINRDGEEFNFSFEDWTLRITPNKIDSISSNLQEFMSRLGKKRESVGKQIGTKVLCGTTFYSESIHFTVLDWDSFDNGIIVFEVLSYVKLIGGIRENAKVKYLTLQGNEINRFFPAYKIFDLANTKQNEVYSLELRNIESEKVNGLKYKNIDYSIWFSTGFNFEERSNRPVKAFTNLRIEYRDYVSYEDAISLIYELMNFFAFINFRKNINLTCIEIDEIDKDSENRFKIGEIVLPHFANLETKSTRKSSWVSFNDFYGDIIGLRRLIEFCYDAEYNDSFIPDSEDDKVKISKAKVLFLLTSFEKKFSAYFGSDSGKSKKYIEIKNGILEYLSSVSASSTGETKSIYGHFTDVILHDKPYDQKIIKVMKIDDDVLRRVLSITGISNSAKQTKFASTIKDIRNSISHGELIYDYGPDFYRYFDLLNILTYFLVLKKADLKDDTKSTIIKKVFNIGTTL